MSRWIMTVVLLVVSAGALTVGPPSVAAQAPPPAPDVTARSVAPPVAGVTDFAAAFSLDEGRVVASGVLPSGARVVFVYDRQPGGGWAHSATIPASAGSTADWGRFVAVDGDTVAVSDVGYIEGSENYGRVHVFRRVGTTWTEVQAIRSTGSFRTFGAGVWLMGDGLVTGDSGYCDGSCYYGRWFLYEQDAGGTYVPRFDSYFARQFAYASFGVDGDRFVAANPGFLNDFGCEVRTDSSLMAWDLAPDPATVVLDQTVDFPQPTECLGIPHDPFRRVDLGGGVLAYESCCEERQDLTVLRQTGAGYSPEAVLPTTELADGLLALPDLLLRLDTPDRTFHTLVHRDGAWVAAADVPVPADAILPRAGRIDHGAAPVAAGSTVAIRGTGVLHLLDIVPAPPTPTCFGLAVTVDLGAGQTPTAGDDVILGTAGVDLVVADAGNDVVCAGDSTDIVVGGPGNDVILGEGGDDLVSGGDGDDLIGGGAGNDQVNGNAGADWIFGGDGDDLLLGGRERDLLGGEAGTDDCDGGAAQDIVVCEVVRG